MTEPPPDPAYAGQPPSYPPPQPFPPQPSAPPQPYPPAQYPPVAYGPPPVYQSQWGYPPAPRPRASAATAIVGSVAGILSGVFLGFMALIDFGVASESEVVASDIEWLRAFLVVLGVGFLIAAAMVLVGSILLLVRKPVARWLIAVSAVIAVVGILTPFILRSSMSGAQASDMRRFALSTASDPVEIVLIILWLGTPLIAAVFAFLPSTLRYCRDKR